MMRAAAALAIAALSGGCFQPLYGEQSPTGGPVLRDQLSAVDVLQIQAPKERCHARLARGWHARAPDQPVQAATVRQGERGSGEE
jgi:hypothetical protein